MRRITIPEPKSMSIPPPLDGVNQKWGLVELIMERVLGDPDLFATPEFCDRVISLTAKFSRFRGPGGAGARVLVTDTEYEFLVLRIQVAIAALARLQGGTVPFPWIVDFASYARALYTAEVVQEEPSAAGLSQGGTA